MSGCSHPGLLLLGAEPAGAQPESTWSPARAREAGTGRNDVDAGEHRPQCPAQEQAGQPLDNKDPDGPCGPLPGDENGERMRPADVGTSWLCETANKD